MQKRLRIRARLRRARQRRRLRFYDESRRDLLLAMEAQPIDAMRMGHGQWHTRHLAERGKDPMGYDYA